MTAQTRSLHCSLFLCSVCKSFDILRFLLRCRGFRWNMLAFWLPSRLQINAQPIILRFSLALFALALTATYIRSNELNAKNDYEPHIDGRACVRAFTRCRRSECHTQINTHKYVVRRCRRRRRRHIHVHSAGDTYLPYIRRHSVLCSLSHHSSRLHAAHRWRQKYDAIGPHAHIPAIICCFLAISTE